MKISNFLIPLFVFLTLSGKVLACSVCFGGKDSDMLKATFTGVLFLGAVIVSVLICIAWTGIVWARRAKKLEEAQNA